MSYLTYINALHLWDFNTQYHIDELIKIFSTLSSCLRSWLQQIPRQNRRKKKLAIYWQTQAQPLFMGHFPRACGCPMYRGSTDYLFFSTLQNEIWDFDQILTLVSTGKEKAN